MRWRKPPGIDYLRGEFPWTFSNKQTLSILSWKRYNSLERIDFALQALGIRYRRREGKR
jgi:hypothetical protein